MQCPLCGKGNPQGSYFCLDCSMPLVATTPTVKTTASGGSAHLHLAADPNAFSNVIRLVVMDNLQPTGESVNLPTPPYDTPLTLGRNDLENGVVVDIDLTKLGGLKRRVSRRHAAIGDKNNGFFIEDTGSSHGTYVNKAKITPHQPQPIHDGDEIRLAEMVFKFEFKK